MLDIPLPELLVKMPAFLNCIIRSGNSQQVARPPTPFMGQEPLTPLAGQKPLTPLAGNGVWLPQAIKNLHLLSLRAKRISRAQRGESNLLPIWGLLRRLRRLAMTRMGKGRGVQIS